MRLLLGLALALSLLGQSQPPSPTPPIKGDQPKLPTASTKNKSFTDESGAEQSPVVVRVLPPSKTKEETASDKAKDLDQSSANWWMVRLTGAVVVVGLIQAIVFGLQAHRLKETVRVAQASADALMSGERAWVLGMVTGNPEFDAEPNRLSIYCLKPIFQNYGRTPARITRIRGKRHPLKHSDKLPEIPSYEGDISEILGDIMLPPGIPIQPFSICIGRDEFTPATTDLYIYGIVDYLDAYENPHESRFCYAYHVPGGFNPNPPGFYVTGPSEYNRCT